MDTKTLLATLIRDYEQSERVLYMQMLAQLKMPWRWGYTRARHFRLLQALERDGVLIASLGRVSWYRRRGADERLAPSA